MIGYHDFVNIIRVEDRLVIIVETVGVPVYDFNFDLYFRCSHPSSFAGEELSVLRIGPIPDYKRQFADKAEMGLRLLNSPAEHARASELEAWYPILADLTPKSRVFETLPTINDIEAEFRWPVFLKGSRQTSKHDPSLSIITNEEHYRRASEAYLSDAILHWQRPVIREFVPLVPVQGHVPGKIHPSLEFRSFWWYGTCVGWGNYWYQVPSYEARDVEDGLRVAEDAARRLRVPFVVIDFAKSADGRWIVIECNDAQESGYAAIPPQLLWRSVLTQITEPKN